MIPRLVLRVHRRIRQGLVPKPEATDGREVAAAWNTMIANLDKDARAQELRVAEAEEALNRLRFN